MRRHPGPRRTFSRSHSRTLALSESARGGRVEGLSPRRGVALITSLSVLVVLALMATVFATMAGIERTVSRNHVDAVRARMLADSGVHHAIAMLRIQINDASGTGFVGDPSDPSRSLKYDNAWIYQGEDVNENGRLDAADSDVMNRGVLDTTDVPLEIVPSPSFAVENASTGPASPRRMAVFGTAGRIDRVGVSGTLQSATYGKNSDLYTLRVVDANSLVYVNDINPNIPRILDNLCVYAGIPRYGNAIWNPVRAGRAWSSLLDVRKAFPTTAAGEAHYKALLPNLTTVAWVDDKVANPVPLSAAEAAVWPVRYVRPVDGGGQPIYRYGHGRTVDGVSRNNVPLHFTNRPGSPADRARGGIYGWDEINPQWIEITSRAPVNLNTASRPVLMAVLEGLEGFFAMETPTNIPDYGYDYFHRYQFDPNDAAFGDCRRLECYPRDGWGRDHVEEVASLYRTLKVRGPASGTGGQGPDAARIADAIIARRSNAAPFNATRPWEGGPFRSWEDFNRFLDDMVWRVDPPPGPRSPNYGLIHDTRNIWNQPQREYASMAMADVLKANFNPNLHLNELNPDAPLLQRVDKTDLVVASTEGTFRPMGIFRIDSLGRVLQPLNAGDDAWATPANTVVAEAQVMSLVRLYDVCHQTTQRDFYGDPGRRASFGPAVGRWTDNGLAVESGPEPHNGPAAQENEFDGYVQLATNGGSSTPVPNDGIPRRTVPNGNSNAADTQGGALLHAHFTNDFDLHGYDRGRGMYQALTSIPIPRGRRPQFPPNLVRYNYEDPTETGRIPGSPYCPAYSPGNDPKRYRLARTFRLPPGVTAAAPAGRRTAPSDLRVDGAYLERHAALVYHPQKEGLQNSNSPRHRWLQGRVSYWIKPSYDLANAGKIRTYFNMSRLHSTRLTNWSNPRPGWAINFRSGMRYSFNPSPFGHFFLPHQAYDIARGVPFDVTELSKMEDFDLDYLVSVTRINGGGSAWRPWQKNKIRDSMVNKDAEVYVSSVKLETMFGFKPRSFAFGYGYLQPSTGIDSNPPSNAVPEIFDIAGQEIAANTKTLNHDRHPGHTRSKMENVFTQARWTHVTLAWNTQADPIDRPRPGFPNGWNDQRVFQRNVQVRINGREFTQPWDPAGYWSPEYLYDSGNSAYITWQYQQNPFNKLTNTPFSWGVDEYQDLNPIRIGTPSILDPRHRVNSNEFRYESNFPADATIDEFYMWDESADSRPAEITNFAQARFQGGRYYNGANPVYTSPLIDLTRNLANRRLPPAIGSTSGTPSAAPTYRLYGMYWTAFKDGIYNYRPTLSGRPPARLPTVGLDFAVAPNPGAFTAWKYQNELYSPILQDVPDPTRFQYRFRFTNTGNPSYTLLETPVLDDVWFIYGTGQVEILEWFMM